MKILSSLLIVFSCLSCIPSYAQQQDTIKVKSVEEAINTALESFRTSIHNENAIVYCLVKYKLNMNATNFNERNLLVKNSINAKYIDRKSPKYVLYFIISSKKCETIINVSTASLEKKSRKKITLSFRESAIPVYKVITSEE